MTTETLAYKALKPITGATWLLSGWRNRWLRRWVRLSCNHKGQHIYKIITGGWIYLNEKSLGKTDTILMRGCMRCNRVFYIHDYRE
jgi:hypothetical protein